MGKRVSFPDGSDSLCQSNEVIFSHESSHINQSPSFPVSPDESV